MNRGENPHIFYAEHVSGNICVAQTDQLLKLKNKRHPYNLRLKVRERLPWFLINLGIGRKGKNCESVAAKHKWYNIDNEKCSCL